MMNVIIWFVVAIALFVFDALYHRAVGKKLDDSAIILHALGAVLWPIVAPIAVLWGVFWWCVDKGTKPVINFLTAVIKAWHAIAVPKL